MYWKGQKIDVTKDNKEYIMPIKFGKPQNKLTDKQKRSLLFMSI